MTDEQREQAIRLEGQALEAAMSEWESSGCFAAHGDAVRHQSVMFELIKGRSAEQVQRMEQERGLL